MCAIPFPERIVRCTRGQRDGAAGIIVALVVVTAPSLGTPAAANSSRTLSRRIVYQPDSAFQTRRS
eukprot:SAG31_NODE_8297_length_1478_cov_4.476432_2_plen_66_part_00